MIGKKSIEGELIDSNLLIYLAVTEDKEKEKKVQEFVASKTSLVISNQSLREIANVLLNKYKFNSEKVLEQMQFLPSLTSRILFDNYGDIIRAIEIFNEFKIPFWDSLIIATAERHGITKIYTENVKDFAKFSRIKAINPLNG